MSAHLQIKKNVRIREVNDDVKQTKMYKLRVIHHYFNLRTALFWFITQRVVQLVVQFLTDVSGQPIGLSFRGGFLTPGGGTHRLFRNVGNKLPLLAA